MAKGPSAISPKANKVGREHWVQDHSVTHCSMCSTKFDLLTRKHHCRACGNIFCWRCCNQEISFTPDTRKAEEGYKEKEKRVCKVCYVSIDNVRKNSATPRTAEGASGQDHGGGAPSFCMAYAAPPARPARSARSAPPAPKVEGPPWSSSDLVAASLFREREVERECLLGHEEEQGQQALPGAQAQEMGPGAGHHFSEVLAEKEALEVELHSLQERYQCLAEVLARRDGAIMLTQADSAMLRESAFPIQAF